MPPRRALLALAITVSALLAGCAAPEGQEGGAGPEPAASPLAAVSCEDAPVASPRELPPPLTCRRDAATGAALVRLDAGGARPESASVSPFNADGSRILLYAPGDDAWVLVDGRDGTLVGRVALPENATEPRWSPLDPDLLYFVDGNAFGLLDVATNATRTLARFDQHRDLRAGGRADLAHLESGHVKVAYLAERRDGSGADVLVLSVREREAYGRETVSVRQWALPADEESADEARVTPEGRVLVAGRHGVAVHDADSGERLRTVALASEAFDVCRARGGGDVLVARRAGDGGDALVAVDLASGDERTLLALGPRERVVASCRATDAPGYAVVSAFFAPDTERTEDPRYADRVVLVDLASGNVETLATHGAVVGSPASFVPVAVPDRNLSRALVVTNGSDAASAGATVAVGAPPGVGPGRIG